MANNPDWTLIRSEYEQGASLRALAAKHDVSKTTLIRKRDNEEWYIPRNGPRTGTVPPTVHNALTRLAMPQDVLSIANLLLQQLARNLQAEMDIRDIKLASDALASCAKVKLTYPPEEEQSTDGFVLWPEKLLPETQLEIRRLLEVDEQRQQRREERVG